jgi:adenylate cyclase class 2
MAADQEVEIKFRVANARRLAKQLKAAGFRLITRRTFEANTLYDLPGGQLRNRGELLRLREYGKYWLLTHKKKGQAGIHKTRTEIETKVEDGRTMDMILRSLGFAPSFRYEKFRSEWSDGQGRVVVDETPIGSFGEIEGRPRWIDATAKRLGISRDSYLVETYAGLFFAWKASTGSRAGEMTFKSVKMAARSKTAPN